MELIGQIENSAIAIGVENLPMTSFLSSKSNFVLIDKDQGSFFPTDPFYRSSSFYELSGLEANYQRLMSISPVDCGGLNCKNYRKIEVMLRYKFDSSDFNKNVVLKLIMGPLGLQL